MSHILYVHIHRIALIDITILGLVGFIQDIYTVRENDGFISLSLFLFNSSIDVEVNFTTFELKRAIEGMFICLTEVLSILFCNY